MLFHSKKIYFLAVSYAFILFFGFFGLFCFHKVSYASFLVLNVSSTCLLLLLASYPFLLFFIYLCQMPSQYPDMWCSSSGVAKMSIAQNISVLCKRLTPLLAVLISSECTRARRDVPVAGFPKMSTSQNISVLHKRLTPLLAVLISSECTRARGGIPVAGLLKWALLIISVLYTKGLPRYWQCWSLRSAPEQGEVFQ